MSHRTLTILTTLLAAAGAAVLVLVSAETRHRISLYLGLATVAASSLACIVAARHIGIGDRLGQAWLSLGIGQGFLTAMGIVLGVGVDVAHGSLAIRLLQPSLILGANVFHVLGCVQLARVWSGTGLEPEGRWLAVLLSIVVSLAVAGPGAWHDVTTLHENKLAGLAPLFSDLGDIVSLIIIGPLAATAVALRGGALAWPWTLLTVSSLVWLVCDASNHFGPLQAPVGAAAIFVANLFTVAAAWSQNTVVRQAALEGVRPSGRADQ
jgi:hypothetical protein